MDQDVEDKYLPTPLAFKAIQSASVKSIVDLSKEDVRLLLPTFVRTSMGASIDTSVEFSSYQREIQKRIANIDAVNSIASLLSINFSMVQEDAIKEQHLQKKLGNMKFNDDMFHGSHKGLLVEFEESDPLKRMRLVLSEILRIQGLCEDTASFCEDDSELFECEVYLEEITDILCIAFSELPSLLNFSNVAEVLMRVRFGPIIICRIVANNTDYFGSVCSSVLSQRSSVDEFDIETQIRMKTLKLLCSMNPCYCKTLRAECVSSCKLAGLAINLSISSKDDCVSSDIVSFFTCVLLASDSKTKSWISEYIKGSQKDYKDSSLSLFRNQLINEMKTVISSLTNAFMSTSPVNKEMGVDSNDVNNSIMQGIAIMRLYCALKAHTCFKLSHEESEVLLDMLTCEPTISAVGARYVVVSICTLVACGFLLQTVEREEKVITWLKALVNKSSHFKKDIEKNVSYGETLLLIAIHFHGHGLEPVVELVSSTLGIKMKLNSLTKIKILFTQRVFPEKIVAEHAITVPATKHLNNSMKGFLPVHCVLQLMKSRAFTKNTISVRDWLFKQICYCEKPVHCLMLPIIETYVHAIISPINLSKTKTQRLNALEPFDEKDIMEVFTNQRTDCYDMKTTKMLLLCYVLVYQDSLLMNMKTLVTNPKAPREYTTFLYSYIPIKQLLLEARGNEEWYGDLYPPLLSLISTHYPHLCLVEDWMVEEELVETATIKERKTINENEFISTEDENALLSFQECPQKAIIKLQKLIMYPARCLLPYLGTVITILPKLLNQGVARKVQLLVVKVWRKLNTVVPRRLWLLTVNALRQQPSKIEFQWECVPEYTDEEIQKDPLVVLRCDSRVFRCPPLFDIIVPVLNGYLMSSRALLNHHLLANPIAQGSKPVQELMVADQEREDLKTALIATQESAAIQMLIEVCLPTDVEKKSSQYAVKSTLREIQCKVCCFLHQSFIANPNMAKLVHFQSYPPELLAVTVTGVPSMHICLDYIPELLNQPHLEKQLFAVQLISYLALQYPIPKSFSMCKLVLQRLKDLLSALPATKRNQYFVPATECLVRISQAFPPLREDVTEFLLRLGKIALSQWNKTSLTVIPKMRLDEKQHDDYIDDGMEIDGCFEESNQSKKVPEQSDSNLNNLAISRTTYSKNYSNKDLHEATEVAFEVITKLSLSDKLVILGDDDSCDESNVV